VRRSVTNEEDDAQRLLVRAPLDLVDGVIERLVDALRRITAATSTEALDLAVDRVEVVGEVSDLGDVLIAAVLVGNQADLEVRGRFAIVALAPSMRPPMLPVVSRQNTTSTFGLVLATGAADEVSGRARQRPTRAASNQSDRK
jgi:hypothetical protein